MDGLFAGLGPAEVRERVARQIEEAQQRAAAATGVRTEIESVRERASSPRRELTVTVDASGRLLDVELAVAAMDLDARALGRLIVETAGRAQRAAGERAAQIAAEAFGEDDPAVAHLRSEIEERLPEDDNRIEYR